MRTRWLCSVLVLILILTGPAAPMTVLAQTQSGTPVTSRHETGAAWVNVFYVPGKAILCGLGAIGSAGILLLTFGQAYRPAVQVYREGCQGKWTVSGEDIAKIPEPRTDLYSND